MLKKRKKSIIGGVLVVLMIVVVGCIYLHPKWYFNEKPENSTDILEYSRDAYSLYNVRESDLLLYQLNSDTYILTYCSANYEGKCYFSVTIPSEEVWKEPQLVKVSTKYLVFSIREEEEWKDRKLIAVESKPTVGGFEEEIFHQCVPYEQLSLRDKNGLYDVELIEEDPEEQYEDVSENQIRPLTVDLS